MSLNSNFFLGEKYYMRDACSCVKILRFCLVKCMYIIYIWYIMKKYCLLENTRE